MKIITLTQLIALNVCEPQINLFKTHCGESVSVSKKTAVSLAHVFHFDDVSRCLLSKNRLAEYEKTLLPLWWVNKKLTDPAWAKFMDFSLLKTEKLSASELAKHYKAKEAAWCKYKKASKKAAIKLDKAKAILFVKFYNAA